MEDAHTKDTLRQLIETLTVCLQTPARAAAARALKATGADTSDAIAAAINHALTTAKPRSSMWQTSTSDAEAASLISALDPIQRTALVLHHGRRWTPDRVAAALGVSNGEAAIQDAEAALPANMSQRVAWEVDNQLRAVDVEAQSGPTDRRTLVRFAMLAVAVLAILGGLAITRRTIPRPDLIQLQENGLVRVTSDGDTIRLIEEQVTVAKVSDADAVLYQYSGGPGIAGGSVWYSPGPGQRSGQVIAKTGGILGWVEPDLLPPTVENFRPQGIALIDENVFQSGVVTTTHQLVLFEPETGTSSVIAELGASTGDGEKSDGGTKPVFASYGGGTALVWLMDAETLESLPSGDVDDCGTWQLMDLAGTILPTALLPTPTCSENGPSLSAPTLNPDGSRVMWLESTGSIDEGVVPREGWLSTVTTTLHVVDLASERRFAVQLADTQNPTFWGQYTMFSQQTGTLSIDSEGDIVVVSIGIWNPELSTTTYTTYLVDLISERVERSIGDGPVTFGN